MSCPEVTIELFNLTLNVICFCFMNSKRSTSYESIMNMDKNWLYVYCVHFKKLFNIKLFTESQVIIYLHIDACNFLSKIISIVVIECHKRLFSDLFFLFLFKNQYEIPSTQLQNIVTKFFLNSISTRT